MRTWLKRGGATFGMLAAYCGTTPTGIAAETLARATPQFIVRSEDGRDWNGQTATIDIRPELPDGAPAVVEGSFAAMDARGSMIGVHLEMDPGTLLSSSRTGWVVSLDHVQSTRPGFGVLSYARNPTVAPNLASKGALNGWIRGKVLEGAFSSNAEAIASGTFRGAYLLRCWAVGAGALAEKAEKDRPVGGTLSSGYAMAEDTNFSTPFCSRFTDLRG